MDLQKTRPDTAKPLAFFKSAAKTTSETSNSLQTSKISLTSVILTKGATAGLR